MAHSPHGVHMVQDEAERKLEPTELEANGMSKANKRLALVIAILALLLSFAEAMGNTAQTDASNAQSEASDMWNFYQAKNIRRSSDLLAVEQAELELPRITDPALRAAHEKQIAEWNQAAELFRSDPAGDDGKGAGMEQLLQRAKGSEHNRDEMLAKYHKYEFASAAFQIGIVLASAAVLTGLATAGFLAGGLAVIAGLTFMGLGLFAPHLFHLH